MPLRDVFLDYSPPDRWLILGKGPSLDTLSQHDLSGYTTLSLNHVVRQHKVTVAHLIDLDVVDQLGETLLTNADCVWMPYHPHMGWRPGDLSLDQLSRKHPILSQLSDQGRLYGYNLSTTPTKVGDSPVVKARYYSAEAAVNLLAKLGVKHIRTLGVDGGGEQSPQFSDLKNFNKERGYDLQWQGIRKSIQRYQLDYAPLGVESPIRIFIGAGEQQLIPALVLKHSILKHATMSVEVTIMNGWTHPIPRDKRNWPRTPFSFQRFMIPEHCDYQGHAIYMDSDMLVFGDVKELWLKGTVMWLGQESDLVVPRYPDTDKHMAQFSVMKMNCLSLRNPVSHLIECLDKGIFSYEQIVFEMKGFAKDAECGVDPAWNSLESYTEGVTKLLHYTEMYNQPWLRNPSHPLGHLWFSELKEAIKDGSIPPDLLECHIAKGWVLPSCLHKIA